MFIIFLRGKFISCSQTNCGTALQWYNAIIRASLQSIISDVLSQVLAFTAQNNQFVFLRVRFFSRKRIPKQNILINANIVPKMVQTVFNSIKNCNFTKIY